MKAELTKNKITIVLSFREDDLKGDELAKKMNEFDKARFELYKAGWREIPVFLKRQAV